MGQGARFPSARAGVAFLFLVAAGCGGGSTPKDGSPKDAVGDSAPLDSRDGGDTAAPDTLDAAIVDARDAASVDSPTSDTAPNDAPATDGVVVDVGAADVPVPTTLIATVLDRRQTSMQLAWPAPATGTGARVAGYDIRVARVPITAANFDDTTGTLSVTYAGTPAAPGQADGVAVRNLNIEQGYYFAVVGKDAGGTRGTIMATVEAVQARFMTTVLTGAGTDGLGGDVDGSGDFGGSDRSFATDGFSDLVVGGLGGTHAYIYFGSATGYPSAPAVTITGTVAGFGSALVNAGDLDGDSLADIAIASPADGAGGRIFVFSRKNPPASWGSTTSWPAALTEAQATYVLTGDASYAGAANSIRPRGMARLGNFDGTGTDDLAIGFTRHSSTAGGILIVKGGPALASTTIPGTGTIQIDGTIAAGFMGFSTVGIGQFFPSPAGPALVTSAAGASTIYAYSGRAPAGVLTASDASDSLAGPTAADYYGYGLGFIGPLPGSPGALASAAPFGTPPYVDVHVGTSAAGPLLGPAGGVPAPSVRLTIGAGGNSFGALTLGGGVKGTSQVVSFIGGDAVPDLILGQQSEANMPIYIVNGSSLSSLSGSVDVSAPQAGVVTPIVRVADHLPSGWTSHAGASVVVDSNKDGYGDFVLGEFATGKAGRVAVFY
jgi:hypothetical protein